MSEQEPTRLRLARDLAEAGCPADMVQRASEGYYDDYLSPIATPELQLHAELKALGKDDLAAKVVDGHWDATKEESDAWATSPEGQDVMRQFGPVAEAVFGKRPNRAQRRKRRK